MKLIGFSPVAAKAFRAPGMAISRPSRKRGVPKGAGPGRAQHDQGGSGFAYDADGLEFLGLGPGLTVPMGVPSIYSSGALRRATDVFMMKPTDARHRDHPALARQLH